MRYTRTEVVNTIVQNLINGGMPVSETKNIEDTPQRLRHACAYSPTLVSFLDRNSMAVPDEMIPNLELPFYYCPYCGKLYVYRHLYG